MPADIKPLYRVPLLILAFISLGIGVGAGLVRLGWHFPLPSADLVRYHGPLMVSAFFGTVISLERAVALGRRWAYTGPLFAGLGGGALVLGLVPWGRLLLMLAGFVLVAASANVYLRQRAVFTLTLMLGAVAWSAGSLLWGVGWPIQAVVPWWIGFLVLTIAGERLELSRFLPPSRTVRVSFALAVTTFATGIVIDGYSAVAGQVLTSAGLIALTFWLGRHDIARRTVRGSGLTRYVAVALLSGYAWLAAAGIIGLVGALDFWPDFAVYDAVLHAIFLGFVFSMVFGHAPIIFPAVLRSPLPYHPLFYAHLILLHFSLALRVTGDLAGEPALRMLGGAANAAALLAFVLITVASIIRARYSMRRVRPGGRNLQAS